MGVIMFLKFLIMVSSTKKFHFKLIKFILVYQFCQADSIRLADR